MKITLRRFRFRRTNDGTAELRDAIKTAFPQLHERDVAHAIHEMREKNREHGGA